MSVFQVRTLSRTDEARGLFWLMEEEVLQPGGSEETLLQRLFSYYGPAEGESTGHTHIHAQTHKLAHLHSALDRFMHCFSAGHTVVLKSENSHHFLLGHSHGTDWVEYDTHGWLNLARLNPTPQNAANLLQNSQK